MIAKLALASVPYAIDKPYDYRIPEELEEAVQPGMRVLAPFSKGNRLNEGIVLSVTDQSEYPDCKPLIRTCDEEPLFTAQQLQLAYFMRERYFCTVYEALRVMVPAGYWLDAAGRRRTREKTVEMVRLMIPGEEARSIAEGKRRSSPKQAEILDLLSSFEVLPSRDLLHFAGTARQTLRRMQELALVEFYAQEVYRRPELSETERTDLPPLTAEQECALQDLCLCPSHFPDTGGGKGRYPASSGDFSYAAVYDGFYILVRRSGCSPAQRALPGGAI